MFKQLTCGGAVVTAFLSFLPVSVVGEEVQGSPFIRGDANLDGKVDMSDVILTLDHLFLGRGQAPCLDAADADDNGALDITDPIFALRYLFLAGPAMPAPFPQPGMDPTASIVGKRTISGVLVGFQGTATALRRIPPASGTQRRRRDRAERFPMLRILVGGAE